MASETLFQMGLEALNRIQRGQGDPQTLSKTCLVIFERLLTHSEWQVPQQRSRLECALLAVVSVSQPKDLSAIEGLYSHLVCKGSAPLFFPI